MSNQLTGRKYSGDLYGRSVDNSGNPIGDFFKLGNVSGLQTSREVEKESLTSTGVYDYGEAIAVEIKPGETEIEINFNSFNKDGLARAMMGTAFDLLTTVETVTKESFPAFDSNGWRKLPHEDIDPETFKLYDTLDTEITAENYELNTNIGMLRLTETGQSYFGQALQVSYKTKGRRGFSIDANTLQKIDMELFLDGKDRISGRSGRLWIPHAVLSSNGDIDWFSDDWWENGLTGTLINHGETTMRFTEYEE